MQNKAPFPRMGFSSAVIVDNSCFHELQAFLPLVLPPTCASSHHDTVDPMDLEEEVVMFAVLHKRIYKIKRFFNKFLAQYLACVGFLLVYFCNNTIWSPK
jgi:hypothetical protein